MLGCVAARVSEGGMRKVFERVRSKRVKKGYGV